MSICRKNFCLRYVLAGALIMCSVSTLAYRLMGISWKNETARYYLNSSDRKFDPAFIEAMQKWNGKSDFDFTYRTSGDFDPCTNVNNPDGRNSYRLSADDCGRGWDSRTLAVTYTWYDDDDNIIDADIIFNSGNYEWGVHNGNISNSNIDFRRVAVHELGHALGLNHSSSSAAIMQPTITDHIIDPRADDINGMRAIYGGTGGNDFFVQNPSLSTVSIRRGDTMVARVAQHYVGSSGTILRPRVGYYLSKNTILDSSDQLLGSDASDLNISDTYDNEVATLTIPTSRAPGAYYILFVADHDDRYSETNEFNNSQAISITIESPVIAPMLYLLLSDEE